MTKTLAWQDRIGTQRDWVWRGWKTRYTYLRPQLPSTPDAPPLMLLHGFGASIGHWRNNLADLSQNHTVYALDMLGFGASAKALTQYDIGLWVEQIFDFWRTFVQQPVVLIGNSIGSLVCLSTALAHPEMVQGVAMISLPDPSVREEAMPAVLRPLIATAESLFASPPVLKLLFHIVRRPSIVRPWAAIAYATPEAVTEELVEILLGPAQDRGSAQAFCAILKAMVSPKFGPKVKSVLPQLQVPMLLLWGQQDRMVPPALGREFAQCNSRLQLVELAGAGHCAHDECPEQVNGQILSWIRSWQSSSETDSPPVAQASVPASLS